MPVLKEFAFRAATNVRAYGTITVEAENLETALAQVGRDDFMMSNHFSPHGGGSDDFDWNNPRPEIYIESVVIDDEDESEETLELDLPDPIPSSGRMSFRDALRAASLASAKECQVYRPNGPRLIVDELGRVREETDCLCLGDMCDRYDWCVEVVT